MPSDTFTLQIFDTGISIPATHASTHLTGGADAIPPAVASVAGVGGSSGLMSALQAQQIVTNNGKVTNASHTGDVTGATELTIGTGKVTADKLASNSVTTAKILNANVTMDKLASNAVTYAKFQTIPANTILGNSTAGETTVSSNACSAFGFFLLGETDAINARSRLGLGSMSTQSSSAVTITGGTIDNVTLTGSTVSVSSPSGILPTANGGTGRSTYTAGDIIYASGIATLSTLPKGAANLVLHGSGGGSLPAWGSVNLASDVSGVLPVAKGGTGLASITGYVKGAGTSPLTASATIPVADISGVLPVAKGGTGPSAYGQRSNQTDAPSSVIFPTSFTALSAPPIEYADGDMGIVSQFDAGTEANTLKYTGSVTRKFLVFASMDILSSTAGSQFAIRLAIENTTILATQCNASVAIKSSGTGIAKLVTNWIVELNDGEEIEIYAAGIGSEAERTGTIQRMRLVATPVF